MAATPKPRAALLCVAALVSWCFAMTAGAVPPARQTIRLRSLISESPADRPVEYPCGREGRTDKHRCAYEEKVLLIEAGDISPPPPSTYPKDPLITGAIAWFNVSSDQLPVSLAASPSKDRPIYVVRGSLRLSRSFVQASNTASSAELLMLNAATGAISARQTIGSIGNPQRLAVDADGNLWIADRSKWEVVKLNGSDYQRLLSVGGQPGNAAGASARASFCLPFDVAAAAATSASGGGFIYVADSSSSTPATATRDQCLDGSGRRRPSRVVRFAASDGAYVDSFDLPSGISGHVRLSVDPRRDLLWVADLEGGRIEAYGAGLRQAAAASGSGAPFGRRHGAETITIGGKIVDVQAHPARNELYLLATTTVVNRTERFTFGLTVNTAQPATRYRWTPPSQPYGFYHSYGLAIDSSGSSLYATEDDGATTRVWKFSLS